MALRVNRPMSTGIPDPVFYAIEDLNRQFPTKWERGWAASLLDDQGNDDWVLKLLHEDGKTASCILNGRLNQHNSALICASLIEMRDMWNKEED